jgi:anti-sigma factor RsiW
MSDSPETRPDRNNGALEAELLAALESRFDAERTWAVLDHLAQRPDRAAEVLADARTTAALRLAMSMDGTAAPPRLEAHARRLQDRLRGQRMLRRAVPAAAAVALLATGWTGHAVWQRAGPPAPHPLVEAALDAQAALDLRHWMVSQAETTVLDSREIGAALGIDLPPLPEDWTIRDVQIVATPDRPAVAISVDAPDFGRVLLMAVARGADDATDPPTAFDYEGRTVALFAQGRSAFVLIDESGHPEQLALGADQLLSRSN